MDTHGKNPRQNVIAIIPARFASVRLEGKLLLPLAGKPLVLHTLEQAKKAQTVSRVIVATDDERILRAVENAGGEAILTSKDHQSGSDRIAEVAETLPEKSIIVNVQADEPLIAPQTIDKAVKGLLEDETVEISTTCEPIEDARDVLSADVVKVITDEQNRALYFSRQPIPFPREAVRHHGSLEKALEKDPGLLSLYRKHTGLYVYRREFLLKYTKLPQTFLEKTELLEQLRALENGARIKVVEVADRSIGVDTAEDFERVKKIVRARAGAKPDWQKIQFRQADITDIPAVARIHVESWKSSFDGIVPRKFLDKMSVKKREDALEKGFFEEFYKMFVVEDADKGIVGFADFGKSRDDKLPFEAELYAIYFLPEFQGCGIGGKLFRLCQQEMVAENFHSMSLVVLEDSPYRKFYEKMGGSIVEKGKIRLAGEKFPTLIYGWEDLRKDL